MNFGEIKAFLGDQPQTVKPSTAINKQLQEEGLKQAANFQAQQAAGKSAATTAASVSVFSSQTTVGLKIYSGSMQQNVNVNGERAVPQSDNKEDKPATLFDFEKVAENVMRFVGGVIKGAAASGADDEKLASLFAQAKSGVAKGIAMAEKDIGGFMNDEISEGISRSRSLIGEQITRLENALAGNTEKSENTAVSSVSAAYSQENSGELKIRTKDGDEVKLEFVDLRQVSFSNQTVQSQLLSASAEANEPVGQQPQEEATENTEQRQRDSNSNFQTLEFSGFRLSISGDLDDQELASIGKLVSDANDLADTFYRGDIETAFNQALELGYDKQELVGYALQLNRVEQTEVVKAYGYVQHFNEDQSANEEQEKSVKPVAQYLDKMLNVLEQSRQSLQSSEDYNTMINGIINEMKDVQVPDLVQAINRFHTFNQQLLEGLPKSEQRSDTSPSLGE